MFLGQESLFFLNVNIGTPPQQVQLVVDTGSIFTWTNTPSSEFCSAPGERCSEFGTYNAAASTSYRASNIKFNLNATYHQGWESYGPFATDLIEFEGVQLENLTFAHANVSNTPYGVLGLDSPEKDPADFIQKEYVSFLQTVVNQGKIKTKSYSMWTDDLTTNRASILFGGIDTSKYIGPLHAVQYGFWGTYGGYFLMVERLRVQTGNDSVLIFDTVGGPSWIHNVRIDVIFDSGASWSYLPPEVVARLYDYLNVTLDTQTGNAVVNCSMRDNGQKLVFSFLDATIDIQMRDMIFDSPSSSSATECIFGILVGAENGFQYVFGNSFLRSLYMVYDSTNYALGMAPRNFDSAGQDPAIVTIDSEGIAAHVNNTGNVPIRSNTTTTSITRTKTTSTTSAATRISSALAVQATGNQRHVVAGLAAGAGAVLLLVL